MKEEEIVKAIKDNGGVWVSLPTSTGKGIYLGIA